MFVKSTEKFLGAFGKKFQLKMLVILKLQLVGQLHNSNKYKKNDLEPPNPQLREAGG
eukprot:UN07977